MKRKWNELQKGDILYVLVPYEDEDGIVKYMYQESSVISIHGYYFFYNIKFKYTDGDGKRQRVGLIVGENELDDDYIISDKTTGRLSINRNHYGDLIVSFRNKECLNRIYEKILNIEINRYESALENLKNTLDKLRDQQSKNIFQ